MPGRVVVTRPSVVHAPRPAPRSEGGAVRRSGPPSEVHRAASELMHSVCSSKSSTDRGRERGDASGQRGLLEPAVVGASADHPDRRVRIDRSAAARVDLEMQVR